MHCITPTPNLLPRVRGGTSLEGLKHSQVPLEPRYTESELLRAEGPKVIARPYPTGLVCAFGKLFHSSSLSSLICKTGIVRLMKDRRQVGQSFGRIERKSVCYLVYGS